MSLHNLAFLLPSQRVDDRTQLPACQPENQLSPPDPVEFRKPPQGETGRILVMMPQAGSKST
jgi:hypothetical protein